MPSILSNEQWSAFQSNGYVLVRQLFVKEEIQLMAQAIAKDPQLQKSLYARKDAQGKATMMATWNHPGDSVYGLAARSLRVVDSIEHLLGDEVYHYHSKLTAKEPYEGGAWEWHQDYGYWYHNGCLLPQMASVMVALDKATKENGCLQVICGSHLAGRVDHGILPGEQVGADPLRVEHMLKSMPLDYVEMEPGDGLFFHSNLMHRSDQNKSPNRRWTVLFCFNAVTNNPFIEHHHPQYTPLVKVANEAVIEAGLKFSAEDESTFMKTYSNPPGLTKK